MSTEAQEANFIEVYGEKPMDQFEKLEHDKILNFIGLIRGADTSIMTELFTRGNCLRFHYILKNKFGDNVVAYHDGDHVISKIGKNFYDIMGHVDFDDDFRFEVMTALGEVKWGMSYTGDKDFLSKDTFSDLTYEIERLRDISEQIGAGYSWFELKVLKWANDRGIRSWQGQIAKLMEELGELSKAITEYERFASKEHRDQVIDAFGDVQVVLIILRDLTLGGEISMTECLKRAYEEIKDRTGRMVGGIFHKDKK